MNNNIYITSGYTRELEIVCITPIVKNKWVQNKN